MKCGVIGTGNMGGILLETFIDSNTYQEKELFINNRTIEKAYNYQRKYPNIHVLEDISKLIAKVDIVYLCVKPHEMIPIMRSISDSLSENFILISITSSVAVEDMEKLLDCQVARFIPSITNRARAGVSLVTFGENMSNSTRSMLLRKWERFSKPTVIEEKNVRIGSDIVSCGPAFFGFLAKKYIDEIKENTDLTEEEAMKLMENMFIGFGSLLKKNYYSLDELINKVCVAGGITGEGINTINEETPLLFKRLIETTQGKFKKDKHRIEEALGDKE